MRKVAPIDRLLRDDPTLGCLLVILADEAVVARLERRHLEPDGLAARDHLLETEVLALEFLRALVLVGDDEHEGDAGLDPDLLRLEVVVLDLEGDLRRRIRAAREAWRQSQASDQQRDGRGEVTSHEIKAPFGCALGVPNFRRSCQVIFRTVPAGSRHTGAGRAASAPRSGRGRVWLRGARAVPPAPTRAARCGGRSRRSDPSPRRVLAWS